MKVCSLYGVGYYYIPGTDTCIKIGGYVRYEAYHNSPGGTYPTHTPAGVFTNHVNTFAQQARFRLTTDVRTQTEYGTLRSYFSFGFNWLNSVNEPPPPAGVGNFTFALERAFIQFAGFTFGRADTFFGFYNGSLYNYVPANPDGSSGPSGLNVAAYTWQFGNGLSATVALEDSFAKGAPVVDMSNPAAAAAPGAAGLFGTDDRLGQRVPDITANLRVDQAWGSAQIMGNLHQVGARYHTNNAAGTCAQGNTTGCSHPGTEWGWAAGAGLTLKMPWDAKDTLSGVIAIAEGSNRSVSFIQGNTLIHKQGVAIGAFTDGVFANPGTIAGYTGGIELTKSWGGTVSFEHYWTPSLRTSWTGGYLSVEYSDTAKALVRANNCALAAPALTAVTNCDPDWKLWRVSTRTNWNPVANLDVGVEVAYQRIDTAFAGTAIVNNPVPGTGLAVQNYNIQDQGFWSAAFRVQRSFWP